MIVSNAADVRYLSGFRGEDATLVIGRQVALIVTDSRYVEQVHEEVTGFDLVAREGRKGLLAETAAAAAAALGEQHSLGYQGGAISHAAYRDLRRAHGGRLRDVRGRVSRLRMAKDEGEVDAIRARLRARRPRPRRRGGRGPRRAHRDARSPGGCARSTTTAAPRTSRSRRSWRRATTGRRATPYRATAASRRARWSWYRHRRARGRLLQRHHAHLRGRDGQPEAAPPLRHRPGGAARRTGRRPRRRRRARATSTPPPAP